MSIIFHPDSAQKKMRYRVSLSKARAKVSVASGERKGPRKFGIQLSAAEATYYPSIKQRRKSKPFINYETGRPYPLNIQFKIRFFGAMHHYRDHGPEKAGKRWNKAWARFNIWPKHRRISSRALNRIHAWS